ncbi:MAG TPA: M48 family metallopeptidase [Thermotogota bacterium]|nr:M48 family metallopeptidase [Thermotogota bacterium]
MAIDFYVHQKKNLQKTIILVVCMLLLVFVVGLLLDLAFGTIFLVTGVLLLFTSIQSLVALKSGYSIVLRSVGAKQVHPITSDAEEKQLLNIVEEMSIASGIPVPEVYVMEDGSINAFATGSKPEKAYVCVTRGLLTNLNREETEGVIAHEMAHVKNRDILLMTMISALVGGVLLLALVAFRAGIALLRGGIFLGGGKKKSSKDSGGNVILYIMLAMMATAAVMFLVGQISRLMTLAISRKREFLADATAVEFTRNPHGLSSALEKIYQMGRPTRTASAATAHLFISEPKKIKLAQRRGFWANMLSTHPPLVDRIAVLEAADPELVMQQLQKTLKT